MIVLFALVGTTCAAAIAVLFITMWLDEDFVLSAALAVALFSTLMLALLAWEEAL